MAGQEEHNLIDGSANRVNLRTGKLEVKAGPNGSVLITDDQGNGLQIAPGGAITAIGSGSFPTAPVTSVFGRTGAVVAATNDYAVNQVNGAAPLASPALTGNPTAPTQAPLSNDTKIATDAYADAAVLAEKTRALAAEALLAPLASPALTGTPTVGGNSLVPASEILETVVNLSAAQIKTLNTVPVTLIPAPGAGLYAVIDSIDFDLVFGTTPFNFASGFLVPCYNANSALSATSGNTNQATINANTSKVFTFRQLSNVLTASLVAAQAVTLLYTAGNATVGDSTMVIKIRYRLLAAN